MIQKSLFLVGTLVFSGCLFASSRVVIPLEEGWSFIKGETVCGQCPAFEDSRWEKVVVPHDWAIKGPFDLNEDLQFVQVKEDGDTEARLRTGRTGALPVTGIGWYNIDLELPESNKDQCLFVEFDGAMSHSTVYLNGHFVGEWPYGYSSFSFNITPYFHYGVKNKLTVRLENKPEMSRFYTGAGLYRPVRLLSVNPVHIKQWGTTITTPIVSAKQGVVSIKTRVVNQTGVPHTMRLVTTVLDPGGRCLSLLESKQLVKDEYEFDQKGIVNGPQLWDLDHPALYRAVSKIYVGTLICDSFVTRFGFRTMAFDANNGFSLNGRRQKIKGVCLHHDLGPLGAAVNRRATERQIQLMKNMGCNAIRTAHNPSSVELLELCDSMGMMVQVEAFDEWKVGKCQNGYNTLFDAWAEKDLVSLIHRDRNHPSVIMWSIGNEVREQDMKEGGAVARFLASIVRHEDPTRPVTAGFNNHNGAIKNGLADAVDLVGFNYKQHDYTQKHALHPDYVLYGSETSSAVSSRGCYKFPVNENWNPWYDDYQVSSYDRDYVPWGSAPDSEFEKQDDNDFLLGEFVWTGFDYLGEPSPFGQGSPSRSAYFGLVDLAGMEKDRYFLYQSHWSSKNVLHVSPHWTWPERLHQKVPVQCYTNYPKAELFVNGKSMGIKEKDRNGKYSRYRLMWDDVTYEPGEIKVIAYNQLGIPQDSNVIHTAGDPKRINLTADRDTLSADGKDLSFVTVEIKDQEGTTCPRNASLLFVSVTGEGRLKALCNGDATDLTSFSSNYMPTFNGRLMIIVESTKKAGKIQVLVSGERLGMGNHTIISR